MNKNVTLIIFAVAAIAIVGFLFLFTPKVSNSSLPINTTLSSSSSSIAITINKTEAPLKKTSPSTKQLKHPPKESKKREIDPTIKAAATDHYNTYLIEILDPNLEYKDVKLYDQKQEYVLMEGKVNGNFFAIKVPKKIVESPNLKLKIINLKTQETTEIDAPFIQDLANIGKKDRLFVNIDTNNPNAVTTDIKLHDPYEDTALPFL